MREIVIDGITYEIRDDGIFDVKTGFEVTNDVDDLNPDEWIKKGREIHARNQGIENYDFKDRDFFSKLKRAAPPPPPPQARVIDALREIPIDDQGKAFGGRLEAPTFGVDEFTLYHEDEGKRLFDFDDEDAHGDFYDRREEITDNITEQKALDIRGYLEEHGKGPDDGYDTDDFEALGFDDNDTDLTFDDAEKFGRDAVSNIQMRMYDDADTDMDNILNQDWNSVKRRIGDRKITKKEAQREFKREFLEIGAEEQVPGFETEIEARLDIPTPAEEPSVEEPSPEVESAPPPSAQKKLTSKDTSNPANFIPGYFEPKQEVMYYRKDNKGKGLWRPAEVVDYQDGGEVGPLLSVKRTTGSGVKQQQVETTMDRVIPKPNPGELLKQKKLREELAGGVIDRAQDWVDRDKFVLHNNTAQELYGIKPNGKSVIGYHKKTFGGGENTYFHSPLDDDGKYVGKKDGRNLGPKFLDPSVNNGLLSLQKLDEVFKEGNAIADLDLSFQLAPPLPQQVSETLPLPGSASSTSSDSVFEEFKEFNQSDLRDENPELSEAELESLMRREYDKL